MKIVRLFLVFCSLFTMIGCEKEEKVTLTGTIVGFVELIDEFGERHEDQSGMKVLLEGTDFSSTTDENGRYEIMNVPAGTYILSYNKENYGTYKVFGFQFVGGDVPLLLSNRIFYEQPSMEIKDLNAVVENKMIIISGTLTGSKHYVIKYFILDSPDVSPSNFDLSFSYGFSGFDEVHEFEHKFDLSDSYEINERIYLYVCLENISVGRSVFSYFYYDPELKENIYPSLVKAWDIIELSVQ